MIKSVADAYRDAIEICEKKIRELKTTIHTQDYGTSQAFGMSWRTVEKVRDSIETRLTELQAEEEKCEYKIYSYLGKQYLRAGCNHNSFEFPLGNTHCLNCSKPIIIQE